MTWVWRALLQPVDRAARRPHRGGRRAQRCADPQLLADVFGVRAQLRGDQLEVFGRSSAGSSALSS
ncbi:hypothetical protein [Ketogulonicigenium vulgare]|uniref:hypothetical protein n=1 Tax=Ketogulonicigenium vulgare TaxID=92945 RepID=UPI0018D315B4|nr:hypothetical protein [Ketogulonicigenium vulgare]